jgi:hypothetical protein
MSNAGLQLRLPRIVLLALCVVLTALAYYCILFTNWGNPYHGASYRNAVIAQAVVVLAVFCCLEVVRSERVLALRAVAGALGVPLLLVTLLVFWYGVRRYVAA